MMKYEGVMNVSSQVSGAMAIKEYYYLPSLKVFMKDGFIGSFKRMMHFNWNFMVNKMGIKLWVNSQFITGELYHCGLFDVIFRAMHTN